ncbi:MAG: hypothetical protein JO272_11695 [Pseudonocardiales bacterium]|jgi:hypothetical protein|nr:hypothetical protein [Pseudonocardiales bacterium]
MENRNRLDRLMGLAAVSQDEPAVEVIQPEVRTGAQYALLPSMRLDDEEKHEE